MSAPTHYQVLKVTRAASHEQIRRAYHDEARKWHPDGFSNNPAAERELAENAMRKVNEAWRTLGDATRRSQYDELLDADLRGPQSTVSTGIRVDQGVTRVDPRLLDPEFLYQQRRYQAETIDNRQAAALRYGPWLALATLLIGMFIFTAYQGDDGASPAQTTLVGPSLGVDANACVRVIEGPQLIAIPCSGVYDGRVIGAFEPGGACPDPQSTIREVELSNGVTACLGR